MTVSPGGKETTPKVDEAINALKSYAAEIESGISAHYPGRHIREWHQGSMSSRELLNMLAGLPFESWFKASVREDMDELIGDATVATLNEVKEKTEALLRGERRVTGPVVIETDMDGDPQEEQPRRRVRRRRAHQARPET